TLKSLNADVAVKEYQQLMNKFATAVALTESNQLYLLDTAGSLRQIVKRIRDVENNEGGQAQTFTYKCEYISARKAEELLKKALGDPIAEEQQANQRRPQFIPGGGQQGGFQFPQNFQPGGGGGGRGAGGIGRDASQQRAKVHRISSDETSNKVIVTGPPDKIAQARAVLKEIDIPNEPG